MKKFSHQLSLRPSQTTKVKNTFANNMATDMKFSKTQISKIIQAGRSFGFGLANLGKNKALGNVAIPLARDNVPGLVSNLTSNAINKFERKIRDLFIYLFILNEDMNDIIEIIKSLEDSDV